MAYRLTGLDGGPAFELRSGVSLVVGRALNSDIPILDPTISRRHAEIRWDDEGIIVRDLGSSNGTFVNGQKVDRGAVAIGDVLMFGKVSFKLAEHEPTPVESFRAAPGPSEPTAGATILRQVPVWVGRSPITSLRGRGTIVPDAQASDIDAGEPTSDERAQHKLSLLLEVSKGLSRTVDIDALLAKIVQFSFEILDVDRAAILLMDEKGDLSPKISRDRQGTAAGRMVPQSIARKAVAEKVAILSDNAPEDQRFGGQSILMQRVRSAMCAPLIGSEDRVLGVLYVDNLTTTHRFADEDLGFLVAFSGIAAVAIENSQFSIRIRREAIVRSNFERYFAPSLAERIASAPEGVRLGGEKRQVAVLFSDIRGFTTLSETMNPDDMASLLTEYFTEMVEVVFRNGGTLDKFIGDAVMAQWGAPLGAPDDPDRAMRAAIEMLEELETLNVKWRADGRPELQIGIGLNYGEVFAGNIGSERRLEFTVIGDTVNTASRLCSAAEGGEILLSDDMRRALRHAPPLDECPAIELRGKAQPVPLYRVAR